MITSAQFNDFVKNAKVKWREGYDRVDKSVMALYDVTDTDEATSELSQVDGYGYARRQGEGAATPRGSIKQGYSIILNQETISLEDEITWKMRRFDKYREINKMLAGMGEAAAMRMVLDLTHQLTFGFSSSFTNMDGETVSTVTGDGLSIFNSAHTITGSSATFSNIISGAPRFGRAGLEAGEALFTRMINMNGIKIMSRPDTIITSDDPETCNAVAEFLESQGSPDSAENSKNPYYRKYKHIVLPLLATTATGAVDTTKAKYWFLANLAHTDAVCEISERPHMVMPRPGGNLDDAETRNWLTQTFATFDFGILDPKWIVGSNAA